MFKKRVNRGRDQDTVRHATVGIEGDKPKQARHSHQQSSSANGSAQHVSHGAIKIESSLWKAEPGAQYQQHHADNFTSVKHESNGKTNVSDYVVKREHESTNDTRLSKPSNAHAYSTEQATDPAAGEQEYDVDRDWYDADEGSSTVHSDSFLHGFDEYNVLNTQQPNGRGNQQQQVNYRMNDASQQKPQLNRKQMARLDDSQRWERAVLQRSGLVASQHAGNDPNSNYEEVEHVAQLLVHDIRPPFLDGRIIFTKQRDVVSPIRDPTSDLAKLARQGSNSVREYREKLEREKQQGEKYWKLQNTKMGALVGAKNEAARGKGSKSDLSTTERAAMFSGEQQEKDDEAGASNASTNDKSIQQQRESLPVYTVKQDLLRVIRDNQVMIVVGETGSGKTTQLTQYLLDDGYARHGKIIGCTQPRRVAAMSVAKRVAEEAGCALGSTVGYTIRFEDVTSKDTKILYMTDGVLTRESLESSDLEQYSVLILDEAHERSLNTDVLFGILRSVLTRRSDLHVIVTSATLDSDRFSSFFGGAPIFHIPGRTYPVDIMYAKSPSNDYVADAVKQVLTIHMGNAITSGDILVFMSGQDDIEATCVSLAERIEQLQEDAELSNATVPPLDILPLYSQLPADLQSRIFDPAQPGHRKCVIATNIAETSITVNGIRYVIDPGFSKLKTYNPKVGMDALQITPIAQSQAGQRAGRAGRTSSGVCYRLYTEHAFNFEMLPQAVPEIQRTNLSNVVLQLKSLGISNLLDFAFMDSPPQSNLLNSQYELWLLGAIDSVGNITDLGRRMVNYPLDPPLARMLIAAEHLQCTSEIVTVVSMLAIPNVFFRPPEKQQESDQMREKFLVPESDHLTLLNVYNAWQSHNYSAQWCQRHFIQSKAMKKVREVREQLVDIMKKQTSVSGRKGVELTSCGNRWDTVRKAITTAYFSNAAKQRGLNQYTNMRTGLPCMLHPTSALAGMGYTAEYIVYHELVMTSKEYMRIVTAVDPLWLAELGPMFFSVKHTGGSAAQSDDAGVAAITRQEAKMREAQHIAEMEASMQREMQAEEERQREKQRLQSKQLSNRHSVITDIGARRPAKKHRV